MTGRRKFRIVKSPKQHPDPDVTFEEFYAYWRDDLHRIATKDAWRFRSTDSSEQRNEAEAEVYFAFWSAYLYWSPLKGDFGKLFWSIYLNRLHTHARKSLTYKRTAELVSYSSAEGMAESFAAPEEQSYEHLPLFGCHPNERQVIVMLSEGYRPTDVWEVVGKKTYYEVMKTWKMHYSEEQDRA